MFTSHPDVLKHATLEMNVALNYFMLHVSLLRQLQQVGLFGQEVNSVKHTGFG